LLAVDIAFHAVGMKVRENDKTVTQDFLVYGFALLPSIKNYPL
jgi:hypothetical protein